MLLWSGVCSDDDDGGGVTKMVDLAIITRFGFSADERHSWTVERTRETRLQ